MVDKILPKNDSNNDQKNDHLLIAAINQSLDKSLDDIDELSLQSLKNARVKALNRSSRPTRKWRQLSVVASLAALMLIPVVIHQHTTNTIEPELEIVAQELPISSEEMDDMDMLMEMEDSDA